MKTVPPAQPKLYIGIDIHKLSWKFHFATDLFCGKSFSIPPEAKALYDYVRKNFKDHQVNVAYEAGCCGYSVHRSFTEFGWHSVVTNPADIHLKDGRLDCIHVPKVEREELRSLFRHRNDIAKDIRRNKSRIKMQLLYFGIKIPEEFSNDKWSHKFRNWLDAVRFTHPTAKLAL